MEITEKSPHTPVLLKEVVDKFGKLESGIFIDCTLGYGGHSKAILESNRNISLIGIDRDLEAIKFSEKALEKFRDRVTLIHGVFSEVLENILKENRGKVVGILADFGVSSLQLDKEERGFSFDSDKLDMRMDRSQQKTAKDILNRYSLNRLEKIFKEFGELREAKKLARAIVEYRGKKEIESAREFNSIIQRVINSKRGKKNVATLPFQAVRIEVNSELEEIHKILSTLEEIKPPNTVVGFITFHSLEDRLVKKSFRKWSKNCICPHTVFKCSCGGDRALGKELNRKPIVASPDEVAKNPRSRSAKGRFFKFKGER